MADGNTPKGGWGDERPSADEVFGAENKRRQRLRQQRDQQKVQLSPAAKGLSRSHENLEAVDVEGGGGEFAFKSEHRADFGAKP